MQAAPNSAVTTRGFPCVMHSPFHNKFIHQARTPALDAGHLKVDRHLGGYGSWDDENSQDGISRSRMHCEGSTK